MKICMLFFLGTQVEETAMPGTLLYKYIFQLRRQNAQVKSQIEVLA